MNRMRKLLCGLFCFALLFICSAVSALAADSVTVYVTVSLDGVLQKAADGTLMAFKPVEVQDFDGDGNGKFSIKDVIEGVHRQYYNGYSETSPGYTFTDANLTSLWGTEKDYFAFLNSTGDNKGMTFNYVRAIQGTNYLSTSAYGTVGDNYYVTLSNVPFEKVNTNTNFCMAYFTRFNITSFSQAYNFAEVSVMANTESQFKVFNKEQNRGDFSAGCKIYYLSADGKEILPLCDESGAQIQTDSNGLFTVKFANPGTYILTGVNIGNEKPKDNIYGAPVMKVHVLAAEPTVDIKLSRNSDLSDNLLDFNAATHEYTITLPENVTGLYGSLTTDTALIPTTANWYTKTYNASTSKWGASKKGTTSTISLTNINEFKIGLEDEKFIGLTSDFPLSEYTFNIQRISLLTGLDFDRNDGSLESDFDPEKNNYIVYVNKNATSLGITPNVANSADYTITINGQAAAAGEEYALSLADLSFDDNEQCQISVEVEKSGEQYLKNIYNLTLQYVPFENAPQFVVQPQDAKYVQTEYALNQTVKELSVFAGANNRVTYQWYCIANDTEAVLIEGATATTYNPEPDVSQKGDYYYYCVAANTPIVADGEEEITFYTESEKALVRVYGDPRPKAEFTTQIPSLSSYGQDIIDMLNHIYDDYNENTGVITEGKCPYTNGFYYKKGDEVEPVKLRLYSDVPDDEAGEYSYSWFYTTGFGYTGGIMDALELYPATDMAHGTRTYYVNGLTHTFLGQEYRTGFGNIDFDENPFKVFVFVDESSNSVPDSVGLKGSGTETDPWQIGSLADITFIQEQVLKGFSFENKFFKMTADITLPKNFAGIGANPNGDNSKGIGMLPFSGTLDGAGHTLTYEYGIANPLFNYVREATVKNLNIYAPYISNYALVAKYVIDYGADGSYSSGFGGSYVGGTPDIINITNVTIKKDSNILRAGFIGGVASGANTVNILNCIIEEGVNIGYDADKKVSAGLNNMGSLGGTFSGTVTNCKSAATLYGNDYVGGIIPSKGQSMGRFNVTNCEFTGKIIATGEYVGGIVGRGYIAASAPNTPCATITNCYVVADISGKDKVGGIFGGEGGSVQSWGNSYIRDNFFYGTVKATDENASVGAIVGYMNSLNKTNVIENNYFLNTCGTDMPVGGAKYIDTSAEHSSEADVTYVNTAVEIPDIYGFEHGNLNRTDDPLGADKLKLGQPMTVEQFKDGTVLDLLNSSATGSKNWIQGDNYPIFDDGRVIPISLTIGGEYKTSYTVGQDLDLTGALFTLNMSDGTTQILNLSDVEITGYDKNTRGDQTLTATYGSLTATFTVSVLLETKPGMDNTITVYFTLYGDDRHDSDKDGNVHTMKAGNLKTWVSRREYKIDQNAKVWDLLQKVLQDNHMSSGNPSGNYVESITRNGVTIGEFTNGKLSGWMYTLNGVHPTNGINEQYLSDGDEIIFHYTDDYTKERDTEKWGSSNVGIAGDKTTNINPEASIDKDGSAIANVTVKEITDALKKAKDEEAKSITITPLNTGKATSITIALPVDSAKEIAKAELGVNVDTKQGSLVIPDKALASIAGQAGGIDIRINIEGKDTKAETVKTTVDNALAQAAASLRGAAETLFANACVTEVTITSNGKEISSFGGHELTINLPVNSKNFTKDETYKVIVVSADGTVETISGKCLRMNGGLFVQVKVSHLSTFIVLNEKEQVEAAKLTMNFADVTEANWFYEAVKFVYEAGLMNGESDTLFKPQGNLNRAMLVTILYRLENQPEVTESNKFTDVAAGQWYTEAVIWASANGIVNGYEDGTFKPTANVSREEMAAMLMRYADFKGVDTAATKDISGYKDANQVASWAQQNMAWANSAGLIQGDENNNLNPQGKATHAEAATILMRLVKNVIS